MFARKGLFSMTGRNVVLATVAAVSLTAVAPSFALAGSSAPSAQGVSKSAGTSSATDFSSQRRRYYRGGGGAAAAAAFAGIVGTGIAIAASQNRRDYYYDQPAYYGGGPYDSYGYEPAPAPYYGGGYGYNRNSSVPYVNGHPIAGW